MTERIPQQHQGPEYTADELEAAAHAILKPDLYTVFDNGNNKFKATVSDALTINGESSQLWLFNGDDKAELTIDNSAHGKMDIYGGRGNDTVVLRSIDPSAQLVQLDPRTVKLIQQTTAGMTEIILHEVEHVQLLAPGGNTKHIDLAPGSTL